MLALSAGLDWNCEWIIVSNDTSDASLIKRRKDLDKKKEGGNKGRAEESLSSQRKDLMISSFLKEGSQDLFLLKGRIS